MSLINDAIKRASAAKPNPPSPEVPDMKLEPAQERSQTGWLMWMVPVILVGAVLLGVLFLIKGWQAARPIHAQTLDPEPIPVTAQETAQPPNTDISEPGTLFDPQETGRANLEPGTLFAEAASQPNLEPGTLWVPPANKSPSESGALSLATNGQERSSDSTQPSPPQGTPIASSTSTPTPPPEPPPIPTFPKLKLQGIYYRPASPSVMVNTKTLYKGDFIDDAEVVEITRHSVKVVWNGETKVLTLR